MHTKHNKDHSSLPLLVAGGDMLCVDGLGLIGGLAGGFIKDVFVQPHPTNWAIYPLACLKRMSQLSLFASILGPHVGLVEPNTLTLEALQLHLFVLLNGHECGWFGLSG